MSPNAALDITTGNIERVVTGPIVREKGRTVIQQIAVLLHHDPSDVKVCSRIGEQLAKVCGKKQNKLRVRAERVDGVLVRIAPVQISAKTSSMPPALEGLQDEIEKRQRTDRRKGADPRTTDDWEIMMRTNRHHGLSHPNPDRISV